MNSETIEHYADKWEHYKVFLITMYPTSPKLYRRLIEETEAVIAKRRGIEPERRTESHWSNIANEIVPGGTHSFEPGDRVVAKNFANGSPLPDCYVRAGTVQPCRFNPKLVTVLMDDDGSKLDVEPARLDRIA